MMHRPFALLAAAPALGTSDAGGPTTDDTNAAMNARIDSAHPAKRRPSRALESS